MKSRRSLKMLALSQPQCKHLLSCPQFKESPAILQIIVHLFQMTCEEGQIICLKIAVLQIK